MSCPANKIPVAYGETWEKPIQLKNLSTGDFFDFTGYAVSLAVTTDQYGAIATVTGVVDGESISFELNTAFWTALGDKQKVFKRGGEYPCEIIYTISGNIKVIPGFILQVNL
jgi:hypothetical protein